MESPIYHFDVTPALNKNVTASADDILSSPGDYYNVSIKKFNRSGLMLTILESIGRRHHMDVSIKRISSPNECCSQFALFRDVTYICITYGMDAIDYDSCCG